nr:isoform 2 of augmin subunit 1 [Quercus suber]
MSESEAKSGGSDATRISDVEKWLAARFGDAGKEVPDFEYTPRSVSYLHKTPRNSWCVWVAGNGGLVFGWLWVSV